MPDPPHPLPPPGTLRDPAQGLSATQYRYIQLRVPVGLAATTLMETEDQEDVLAWEMAALPAQDDPAAGYPDGADPDAAFPEDIDPAWDDDWPPEDVASDGSATGQDLAQTSQDLAQPSGIAATQADFRQGGTADIIPPGPVLASLVDRAWQAGLNRLDDDQRIGFLQATHRLGAWAAALRLSAVAEHCARRVAEARTSGDWRPAEHVNDEIAIALTLTKRSADRTLSLAVALDRLPLTRTALTTGAIDERRAEVIADELSGLDDEHAAAVEALLIRKAPGQTSGELWAAARRAVIAADPSAARRRKTKALKDARVEAFTESSGTAALAGRDLPPAEVLAADRHLTALAMDMRNGGHTVPRRAHRTTAGTLRKYRGRSPRHRAAAVPAGG